MHTTPTDAIPAYSTVNEVAALVRLQPKTVRLHQSQGLIRASKFGRSVRFSRAAVLDYLTLADRGGAKPTPTPDDDGPIAPVLALSAGSRRRGRGVAA